MIPLYHEHTTTSLVTNLLLPIDFGQLTVDFGGAVQQRPPDRIKEDLNGLFTINGKPFFHVACSNFSRRGDLVITVAPATAARRLLAPDSGCCHNLTATLDTRLRQGSGQLNLNLPC